MKFQEHEHEPIPGLPADLPPGERIVWQGQPSWRVLARRALKARWLAVYLVAMLVLRLGLVLSRGEGLDGLAQVGTMAALFLGCFAFILGVAHMMAGSTVYTVTNRRVVFRIGVALSLTWNIPFKRLLSADLVKHEDGSGDIVLQLAPPDRIGVLLWWPHVKPGSFLNAQPALRCLRNAPEAAARMAEAVQEWSEDADVPVTSAEPEREAPMGAPLAEAAS
jgi:hypothetical protein